MRHGPAIAGGTLYEIGGSKGYKEELLDERPYRIILVEPDPELIDVLLGSLTRRFACHVSCVPTAAACLDAELVTPHELVITEFALPDTSGIALAHQLASLGRRPVILLADRIARRPMIAAMRAGIRDVLVKPFPVSELLDGAAQLLNEFRTQRRQFARYHRMRSLVKRVLGERRELHRRTELICRDLVGAHRRLLSKVLTYEEFRG